jgi:hypothetical protein
MQPTAVNFGPVDRSAGSLQRTVTLRRGDGGPITPKVTRTDAKDIAASIKEIKPGELYELEVTLAPPFPNGGLKSAVRLSTGVSEAPDTFIRVLAQIPEHVKVQPA